MTVPVPHNEAHPGAIDGAPAEAPHAEAIASASAAMSSQTAPVAPSVRASVPAPSDLSAAMMSRLVGPIVDTRALAASGLFPDDEDAHLLAEDYARTVEAYYLADLAEAEAVAALGALPSLETRVSRAIAAHGTLSPERMRDLARQHREEESAAIDAATVAKTARMSYSRPLATLVADLVLTAKGLREETDALVAEAAGPARDSVDEARKVLARAEREYRRILSVGAYVTRLAEMDLRGDDMPAIGVLPALDVEEDEGPAPASSPSPAPEAKRASKAKSASA